MMPWTDVLPALQHNLNLAHAEAIGRSPLQVVYGFKPESAADLLFAHNDRQDIEALRLMHQVEADIHSSRLSGTQRRDK